MALTVTQQLLVDDARNVVAKYTFAGTTGDVTVASLVDVSALNGAPTRVKITRVHSVLTGFNAAIIWDATTNVDVIGLMEGQTDVDYNDFGGLVNNAGSGITGDVLLRTDGYTAAVGEDNSHIILWMKKIG